MKINILSDDDIAILKQVVEEKRRRIVGGRAFGEKIWNLSEDQNTPEVYIALVPSSGIPGLNMIGSAPAEDDEPGEAECEIYQLVDDGVATPQLKKMDMGTKTVYNISTATIEGDSEWVLVVKTKTGKWVAVTGGGATSDAIFGIVHKVLGCGYYEVELADWNGITPDPDLRDYTGTSTTWECDECSDLVYGVGTANDDCDAGISLAPIESQLTGLGVYVLAFDPTAITVPLEVPSDCIMLNMGVKNAITPGTATIIGTGTADDEPVYQIVRGYQTHNVGYDKEYECCELTGVWTLIRKTAYIFASRKCEVQDCEPCPTE